MWTLLQLPKYLNYNSTLVHTELNIQKMAGICFWEAKRDIWLLLIGLQRNYTVKSMLWSLYMILGKLVLLIHCTTKPEFSIILVKGIPKYMINFFFSIYNWKPKFCSCIVGIIWYCNVIVGYVWNVSSKFLVQLDLIC